MAGTPPTFINQLRTASLRLRESVANYAGNPSNVYRLSAQTPNTGIIDGAAVLSLNMKFNRITNRDDIENEVFSLEVYNGIGQTSTLVKGDTVQDTSDNAVYCFVQYRAPNDALFARTELACYITRPTTPADDASTPAGGAVYIDDYSGDEESNEHPLTLSGGTYAFSAPGSSAATVYCGVQPLNRSRDDNQLGSQSTLSRNHFLVYVPPIPGQQITEDDTVNFQNTDRIDRYRIIELLSTPVGFVGYICIAEKDGS